MKFVSLHHHTTFSYMDGYGLPDAHMRRAAELEMTAMAVTEHGNVDSHVQVEKAGLKHSVKPIFGIEAYTALGDRERRKFHLTLLAMNEVGYQNLMKITTRSYAEGFYQWPTVSGRILADHNESIIVLSGCSDSLLACSLLGGKSIEPEDASWERAKGVARRFKDLLGDRYYLECQMFPELDRSRQINEAWERLGADLDIPLVATADVHYPQPDDNEMQVILHAAGRGAGSVASQEASWEYSIRLTHPVSDRVAYERMCAAGLSVRGAVQALRATAEIASRCDVRLPKAERLSFPLPAGEPDATRYIWKKLREGWSYRVAQGNRYLASNKQECLDQVNREMEQITSKGFVDYFLMMSDLIIWSKENGVAVGPGRGSSASSLVCYLLRITEVNPMEHPLMLFERFMAPDRYDLPDIDTDFDDGRRGQVKAYAARKYGSEYVANLSNYTRFKGKSALTDVGRVFPHIPKGPIEIAKSLVIERSGGDSRNDSGLLDTVAMFPVVGEIFEKYPDLQKAIRLEGNYRNRGVHAAGLVITNRPIAEICAQYQRTQTVQGVEVTSTVVSVDKKDGEYLGLMKADILGLTTMGMIRIAIDLAGVDLETLYALPLNDPKVIDGFTQNDVTGIFQFEGRATRLVNHAIRPTDFGEIVDINGLSRPGPLFSGTTNDYMDIKQGRKQVEKLHPIWDRITGPTKGTIIYQEQVLSALKEIGQIPVNRVGEIRRIISQKLGEAQFNESAGDFVIGAATLGIPKDVAMHMWGRLVTSATYSFVYAHSASYAIIGYWSMWLKTYHPAEFYTAVLRKADKEAWPALIKDAERHGVRVLGAHPGLSERDWTLTDGVIRAGLLQMPGVGPSKADAIVEWREDAYRVTDEKNAKQFLASLTMDILINVKGIGPAMMQKILAVDPNDPFGLLRIRRIMTQVRAALASGELALPLPTHNSAELLDGKVGERVVWTGFVKSKEFKDYIEDERARTGDDIDVIKARMKNPNLPTGCAIRCYDDADEEVYVRIHRRTFPRFKRDVEAIDPERHLILAVGNRSNNSFGASIYIDRLYFFDLPPEESS